MKFSLFRSFGSLALPILVGLFSPHSDAADPRISWEKMETPHFTIIYDANNHALAHLYAGFAEQAFKATAPAFGLWPRKTVLVIDDSQDSANGSAGGLPYPMIVTYPVLPTSLDSISDYGNWGRELITHEYVHILTFEPATGPMLPLRWVFGNIVRPNLMLPRWYTEGIAVEMETRLSSYGRLRSANYLSIVRSMVEEETLQREDIARINETGIPDWPGGNRPYLMGAMIWNEIIQAGGDRIVGELNLAHSGRIPFLINGPVEQKLGKTYADILGDSYKRAEAGARKQLDAIRTAQATDSKKLEQRGFFSHSPVISPDGKKLAFIGKDHNVESFIALAERTEDGGSFSTAKPKKITEGESINRISWLPDSSGFVYDRIETFERHSAYSDLWRYDLASKKRHRITRGARAREATISADGKILVFVQNTPGSTRLASVGIDGKNPKVLYEPPTQTRVSRPEFMSPDTVVFTEKRDDGIEGLRLLRLADAAAPESVLTQFKPVHFPRMTTEGLLFVSDRSGVSNLYLADTSLKSARPVTNTPTRIMTGELDPATGDLLFSQLTSKGPLLHAAPRSSWARTPAELPKVSRLIDTQWPEHQMPEVELTTERESYSALPYMLPRYWMPYLFFVPDGLYLQASTSAADPVGRHSYSLAAAYDSLTNSPSFFGQYTNRTTGVPITIAADDVNEYIYSGAFRRHSRSAALSGSFFLPGLGNEWRGSAGAQYQMTELPADTMVRSGIQTALSYRGASQKGMEISPESGGSFNVIHTRFLGQLGDAEYNQTDLAGSYYFSRWLPERHALAFFTNASIAPGLTSSLYGKTTIGGNYANSLVQRAFVMRGYGTGVFIGRYMVATTAEYRFPLAYTYRGFGTWPLFVKRLHGAVFTDALTLDGLSYGFDIGNYRRERLGKFFLGSGVELKADATVFYHLPIQLIFGAYYGSDRTVNPVGLFPFIGLSL
jgi:hypothetical protein